MVGIRKGEVDTVRSHALRHRLKKSVTRWVLSLDMGIMEERHVERMQATASGSGQGGCVVSQVGWGRKTPQSDIS